MSHADKPAVNHSDKHMEELLAPLVFSSQQQVEAFLDAIDKSEQLEKEHPAVLHPVEQVEDTQAYEQDADAIRIQLGAFMQQYNERKHREKQTAEQEESLKNV